MRELKNNGSPSPIFDTDADRTYLETTLMIREGFEMSDKMSGKEKDFYNVLMNVLGEKEYVFM